MKYVVFSDKEKATYPVALMVRGLNKKELAPYVKSFEEDAVAFTIDPAPKASAKVYGEFAETLLQQLIKIDVEYIIVTDAALLKALTKAAKVENTLGYILPCKVPGYEFIDVLYAPSPKQVMFNGVLADKVEIARSALIADRNGTYVEPGTDVIREAHYPKTDEEIRYWLKKLVDTDLTIDIEAFSLRHYKAGIGTICLCWDKHSGVSFPVDYVPIQSATAPFGKQNDNRKVKGYLREFFDERARRNTARTLYHNGSYDVYVLIYELYMRDLLDTEGLLLGLERMLVKWDDTQLITYLATNSCAGNQLSLKYQAQEFAGNYAVDVKDITQVKLDDLLRYNLVDGLSTWFVYEKHWNRLIEDEQLDIYQNLLLPCVTDVIQMQLTGMPIDQNVVAEQKAVMQRHADAAITPIMGSPEVAEATKWLNQKYADKRNSEWKIKRITAEEANQIFNLNSPQQLQYLLYEVMGLPVISLTDSKQPSTDGDTVQALISHAKEPSHKALLQHLLDFKAVDKILGTFVPAFEEAALAPDGHWYVFGFYNIGGTLSGRLSSSGPNMQNMPATGSKYAKPVKKMFRAPKGWLLIGLDFNALEAKVTALTTKDPNRLVVYTDGYDSHSWNAYFYFTDQMPDIVKTTESINSIKVKYGDLRTDAKPVFFALSYQGTYHTLMKNCGFSQAEAIRIEKSYRDMYAVSTAWVKERLLKAGETGYVTCAFGLRVRTPLLLRTIQGTSTMPMEAEAEARSAGNALGQSYCMLNSRAGNAFMREVRASKWRLDIRPCGQIHDAQYFMVRDNIDLIHWVNERLVHHASWQELPELEHPTVKLGGELGIFYPSWANEIVIPNGATKDQILTITRNATK